ncbi:hypothetical protein [Ancylothrix sp. D3o]|uniref:hypothetical protein n=1 Tax=Ancylothrix sp. D3o TaxID=2953691 RepID=UPI0021BB0213|nr:hypothetical protein [Ancylothrix sp. D3o]
MGYCWKCLSWLIYLTHRPQSGVYATAEITEQPKILDKQLDIDYWLEKSRLGTKPQAIISLPKIC